MQTYECNLNDMTLHHPTPVWKYRKHASLELLLKMECLQPVGSFKLRGIGHLCEQAAAEGTEHFVSSSGGNAGYAVAYAGRELGVRTTVVVPGTTLPAVRHRIEQCGAQVEVAGQVWDEAHARALAISDVPGARYIPPFDDPLIWQGHATMIAECAESMSEPDGVVVAVGGGGLLCGVMQGLRSAGWANARVLAVETHGAASLAAAVAADELVAIDQITSIASSLGARQVAAQALEEARTGNLELVQVSDADSVAGCRWLADEYRVLVEPACGAAVSGALAHAQVGRWLVIICGGIGVSLEGLRRWQAQLA